MDKANDAKFARKCKGPTILSIPRFFPAKKIFLIIFLSIFTCSFVFAKKSVYEKKDIPIVINSLFEYHVQYKNFDEALVRRTVKYFLEQFDSDKIYLLESEAALFLNITDQRAKEIITHLNRNDFSDFEILSGIISSSIKRAIENRMTFKKSLDEIVLDLSLKDLDKSSYAKDSNELLKRQKDHFVRFYNFQKKRINLDSLARKSRVFDLYQKKMARFESDFSRDGKKEQNDHFFSVYFLKAFSKSLDAHTYFFSEDEAREMRVSLEKNFEGIGVVLSETIDGVIVTDMIKNSPASESKKIGVGDIIVEINKQNVENLPFDKVLGSMKKRESGQLELGLRRANSKTIYKVKLTARPIAMDEDRLAYSFEPTDGGIIGKIELKSFYENAEGLSSEKDIKDAIKSLRKAGNLKGLVLDMRENAGGFLSQAIKVAGIFMSNGVVVMSRYSNGEVKYLRTIEGRPFYNGPLVILTSKMSASAAEIVAQALQDYGVALVVGDERTFGKGSIQYQTVTNENSDYYFKVTIGRYYTVSGKSTQINGVKADIVVPSRYSPFDVGECFLENALPPDTISSAYIDYLSDLEPKLKRLFERSYLPALQRVVVYWTKMLPRLQENSKKRLDSSKMFQGFLEKQEQIRAKIKGVNIELGEKEAKTEDLQLKEAVNIVQDMINLESESRQSLDKKFANSQK